MNVKGTVGESSRQARKRGTIGYRRAGKTTPYLAVVRAPTRSVGTKELGRKLTVATYNVHRWAGINTIKHPNASLAAQVISEMGADVVGLQEVLRPFGREDPLEEIAENLRLHLAMVVTRVHRRGEIGNAILSRWPITSVFVLDLSHSRVERRAAVAVQFMGRCGPLAVVATHLSLVDRTRRRQVHSILDHPRLQGPVVLLGDMNAWRRCKATRELETRLVGEKRKWPRTFPAARPVFALDRVYVRGAELVGLEAYSSAKARRASDHLPVRAQIHL